MSHTYLYKKLSEYGENHDHEILTKVAKEGERMKELSVHTDGNAAPTTCLPQDQGRKIVFDNLDFKQLVHHMTEDHQNIDEHWVSHISVENRVSGNHLAMAKPTTKSVLKIENAKFVPNKIEHVLQRENYASLVSRILVDNIPCLHFLKECASRHIKHAYSSEMIKKTENVSTTEM